MEEEISELSNTTILTTSPEDLAFNKEIHIHSSFSKAGDQSNGNKVNLFMLKCSRGTTPDFPYDSHLHGHKLQNRSANRDFAACPRNEKDLPVVRSSGIMHDVFHSYDGNCIYPRISEQMVFIREMMRRPIRDVLSSYYNLREAECQKPDAKRMRSNDSIRFENGLTIIPISRFDTGENSMRGRREAVSHNESPKVDLSTLEKKTFSDCGTQVSFRENGLKGTETITLGNAKTKKLKTHENDILPPLYLFGNKDLARSNIPLKVSSGKTHGKLKGNQHVDPKESKTVMKGMTSSQSFLEGLAAEGYTVISNLKNSEGSCKDMLPPNQKNTFGNNSCSSAQDRISAEVITLSDDNPSICTAESDESFSLFYSKTADLASPLLDMRRFIYPDHIHYSYKNVRKKGFDVELNGGLPLLVRDSLTLDPSMNVKRMDTPPDSQTGVTRRPMDLTFANMNIFPKESNQPEPSISQNPEKSGLKHFEIPEWKAGPLYGFKSYSKTLKKEQKWLKKFLWEERARNPDDFNRELVDTSSMNLHSNKARPGLLSNPAAVLRGSKLKKKLQNSRLKNIAGSF